MAFFNTSIKYDMRKTMRKSEYWHFIADILTKKSEMCIEWSSTKHITWDLTSQFVSLSVMATKRLNWRKILKNQLLRSYIMAKAEPLQNVHSMIVVFSCGCIYSLVTMATWGARWLSGRVSDSGARGPGFETYRRRVVSLSKTLYSPKVLVNYPGSDGSVPTWLKNCWLGR